MKIGITGASGHLGSSTVRELVARLPAESVVAISRKHPAGLPAGVESRRGDFDDPLTLATAFEGLDKLLIIPTSDVTPGKRSIQHGAAIEAARLAGIGHTVFVSAVGTQAPADPAAADGYWDAEQALIKSGMRWSILRMAYYSESFADQARMALPGGVHACLSSTPVNFVSREDLAAAAAGLLATDGHHGATYNITGPAALDGEARSAAIARASGKPMAFAQVSREQLEAGLNAAGLPPFVVGFVLWIEQMWGSGLFHITTGDVRRLTGRDPRSLDDVLARAFSR